MSKAVMLSIRPKWAEKIVNGEKTIEVRKTRPKLGTPFKCYIYCTLPKYPHEDFIATDYPMPQFYGGGKVIGEFTCKRISLIAYDGGELSSTTNAAFSPATRLTQAEIIAYIGDKGRFAEPRALCRETVTAFGHAAQIETVQSNREHIGT